MPCADRLRAGPPIAQPGSGPTASEGPHALWAAAWDKVDGALAKWFRLDESKYQWAIEAHRLQEQVRAASLAG